MPDQTSSQSLGVLSQRVRKLDLYEVVVGDDLFLQDNLPPEIASPAHWARLESFYLYYPPVTPSGQWFYIRIRVFQMENGRLLSQIPPSSADISPRRPRPSKCPCSGTCCSRHNWSATETGTSSGITVTRRGMPRGRSGPAALVLCQMASEGIEKLAAQYQGDAVKDKMEYRRLDISSYFKRWMYEHAAAAGMKMAGLLNENIEKIEERLKSHGGGGGSAGGGGTTTTGAT
ncbi:hypothetical protein Hte_004784 [Hypoxylon texense]